MTVLSWVSPQEQYISSLHFFGLQNLVDRVTGSENMIKNAEKKNHCMIRNQTLEDVNACDNKGRLVGCSYVVPISVEILYSISRYS